MSFKFCPQRSNFSFPSPMITNETTQCNDNKWKRLKRMQNSAPGCAPCYEQKNWMIYYFGGARSKGFATLRNVSKLQFFDKIGHAKSVDFRLYSALWRSESRISSRYMEITSISLIYSLTFSRKKDLLFWLSRGLNRLTCVTRQIRGDSKLRD